MISVVEPPFEYIPRGRAIADEHTKVSIPTKYFHLPSENALLQRLQNVNITEKQVFKEFWSVRNIYERCDHRTVNEIHRHFSEDPSTSCSANGATPAASDAEVDEKKKPKCMGCGGVIKEEKSAIDIDIDMNMYDYVLNSEEELYVKGHTAVWTKGLPDGKIALTQTCFTCETEIKFAFFYRNGFVSQNLSKSDEADDRERSTICLIDQNLLYVYSSNGERHITNLQFPVSRVWPTCHGVLLEKLASTTMIQNHAIMMPRLFSLTHPLDEICPVLNKTKINHINYLIESDYQIVFSQENCDLLMLYDKRQRKHFISMLRRANNEEIIIIANQNDTGFINTTTQQYSINKNGPNLTNLQAAAGSSYNSITQNSLKYINTTPKNNVSGNQGRNKNQWKQSNIKYSNSSITPLYNLQSTIDQHSICMQDIRKCGQAKPSKPIAPEFCLDQIWIEGNNDKRECNDIAAKVFLHNDIAGQMYFCYLLPRSCKLNMISLNYYGTEHMQLDTIPLVINAKDALALPLMKMMVVLDVTGNIALYSGPTLASKVHIPNNLFVKNLSYKMAAPVISIGSGTYGSNPNTNTPNLTFPRRSSLLPTALQKPANDSPFDEELHLLSPVPPLQSTSNKGSAETCIKIRDSAGNRLTLVYNSGRMLRITLPLLNETKLVGRCIDALRFILNKEQYVQVIMRWYTTRNPPGSRNYDIEKEWSIYCNVLLQLFGYEMISSEDISKMSANKTQHHQQTHLGDARRVSITVADGGAGSPTATSSGAVVTGGGRGNKQMSLFKNVDETKKRRRNDEISSGTREDWEFVKSVIGNKYCEAIDLEPTINQGTEYCCNDIDTSAILFNVIPAVFHCYHLLYEDMKLDHVMAPFTKPLATFLHQLSVDLNLSNYVLHYILDYPVLAKNYPKQLTPTDQYISKMSHQELLQMAVPCVHTQLENIMRDIKTIPYHYIDGINDLSRNVLQIISLILHGKNRMKNWIKRLVFENTVQVSKAKHFDQIDEKKSRATQVVQLLLNMDMTRDDISRLPVTIHLIIADCLEFARIHPPLGCSPATYELILRSELVAHAIYQEEHNRKPNQGKEIERKGSKKKQTTRCKFAGRSYSGDGSNLAQKHEPEDSLSARKSDGKRKSNEMEAILNDGMHHIDTKLLSLRYSDDMRISEVRKFLSSSEPVIIDVVQRPGVTDHDFMEEQEKQLYAICIRTMALPFGRGMFTLRTLVPSTLKSVPIPKLNLLGKEPVKGATVDLQQIEVPANMNLWPTFHNGVAAGLQITTKNADVDSTWIVYNKIRSGSDVTADHAGFLMGLGLNGLLKNLSFMSIYDYLVKSEEMTSVGLLLGIAATHKGTMDAKTTKLLSVHIEALLPATALELDIPQNIQVAALMSLGLLYQGSAKRHIAEVLLQEIGRPPGPEMENCIERESYSLAAGLGLGLVTLGHGETPPGIRDLRLPDNLHYYMVGGNKRPLTGSQKEKYKLASFQIREGDHVNIDVTAPGATLALGLMFFQTNDKNVASWMYPPTTRFLLDLVRPDFLLLRTISHGLIMWSEVEATEKYLYGLLPPSLRIDVDKVSSAKDNEKIDKEGLTQAYCNIVAGTAFSIGLKYSGTDSPSAYKVLRHLIRRFMGFAGNSIGSNAGQATIECCLMIAVLSLSLVFAGSGDLRILRIIRYLRSRIGSHHSAVNYGSHMVVHMSLGFLFLGAGRFTISQAPEAIAALVCALYPKFPIHSNDNRYHLQAFRHLFVLAVEPRLFLPRDIDSKQLSLCNLTVIEKGSFKKKRLPLAPCMLPKLDTLQKVIVNDSSYWTVSFEKKRNWDQLIKILENSACVDIKKRSGCLSHLEDPDRLKSLYSLTLTMEQYKCWEIDVKVLENFFSNLHIINFIDCFLRQISIKEHYTKDELQAIQYLLMLFYNPLIKDKMHVFPIYLTFYEIIQRIRLRWNITSEDVWQIRLMRNYMKYVVDSYHHNGLFSKEIISSFIEQFQLEIEHITHNYRVASLLRQFLNDRNFAQAAQKLKNADMVTIMMVVIFYNLVPNNPYFMDRPMNFINYLKASNEQHLDPATTLFLMKVIGASNLQI